MSPPSRSSRWLRCYVAGPIQGKDGADASREAMTANAEMAIAVGQLLIQNQIAAFVPHLSVWWDTLHPGNSWEAWLQLDEAWIEVADAVLRIPGESRGADREVELAIALGIPVFYSVTDLLKRRETWIAQKNVS